MSMRRHIQEADDGDVSRFPDGGRKGCMPEEAGFCTEKKVFEKQKHERKPQGPMGKAAAASSFLIADEEYL